MALGGKIGELHSLRTAEEDLCNKGVRNIHLSRTSLSPIFIILLSFHAFKDSGYSVSGFSEEFSLLRVPNVSFPCNYNFTDNWINCRWMICQFGKYFICVCVYMCTCVCMYVCACIIYKKIKSKLLSSKTRMPTLATFIQHSFGSLATVIREEK